MLQFGVWSLQGFAFALYSTAVTRIKGNKTKMKEGAFEAMHSYSVISPSVFLLLSKSTVCQAAFLPPPVSWAVREVGHGRELYL